MLHKIHAVLKATYLLIVSITMPLALWALVSDAGTTNGLLNFLIITYTYIYSMIWIVVFLAFGINAFPKSIIGGIQALLGQLLNFIVIFITHGVSNALSVFIRGAQHYFLASTVVLSIVTIYKFWWGLKTNKARSGIFAMGFFVAITTPYAILCNLPLFLKISAGESIQTLTLFLTTIGLTLHSMKMSTASYRLEKKQTTAAADTQMEKKWSNYYLTLLFLSSVGSILAIALALN